MKLAAAFVVKFAEISTIDIGKSISTGIGRNVNSILSHNLGRSSGHHR